MNHTWRLARRRLKHTLAGLIFIGLLVGAGGTVFTAFAEAISHLGSVPAMSTVQVSVSSTNVPAAGGVQGSTNWTLPSNPATPNEPNTTNTPNSFQPPVMEYSNTPAPSTSGEWSSPVVSAGNTPDAAGDGVNSVLAAAMDKGGVYIGERISNVFGSMLKGVLNTLFINTN